MQRKTFQLKISRIKKGLSQWDVAERIGIPNYRISLIENGRVVPKPEELQLLEETLGLLKEQGVSH